MTTHSTHRAQDTAERDVLGIVFVWPETAAEIIGALTEDDFVDPVHRRCFAALAALWAQYGRLDEATIHVRLQERGISAELISELAGAGPSGMGLPPREAPALVNLLRQYRQKRELRQLLTTAAQADDAPAALAADLMGKLSGYALAGGNGLVSMREAAKAWAVAQDASRESHSLVSTGLVDLDNIMAGGFRPGNLIVVGARTSVGKSTLAANIAVNAARAGVRVGFFSVEMGRAEIFGKALSATARIDGHRLRLGKAAETDERMSAAMGELSELPLLIDDSSCLGVAEIAGRARREKAGRGLGLIIVDYLQLLTTAKRRQSTRAEEVGELSRALKVLARELSLPVIALAQLNRQGDSEHPRLSHLRDSGAIEQDADVVILLYPDAEDSATVWADVAKNRLGPAAEVPLHFDKGLQRFDSAERPSPRSPLQRPTPSRN